MAAEFLGAPEYLKGKINEVFFSVQGLVSTQSITFHVLKTVLKTVRVTKKKQLDAGSTHNSLTPDVKH